MMNFIAMDFETANGKRYSACSLALTIVRNGQIADEFYTLINPHTKFFWRNTQIHGIHERDVQNAPDFQKYGNISTNSTLLINWLLPIIIGLIIAF